MRQAKLAELLSADGHTVHTFALEALGPLEGVRQEKYLAEAELADCGGAASAGGRGGRDAQCSPVPASAPSGGAVFPPCGRGKWCAPAGWMRPPWCRRRGWASPSATTLPGRNWPWPIAVPTAEGAIQIAMEELPITLHGARALVIGCGRLCRALAPRLAGLGARVSVAARKFADLAWAESWGFGAEHTGQLQPWLCGYDLVINTVPARVLGEAELAELRPDCLVIDLASKPGGVDLDAAARLGKRVVWALSLPGKVAPVTAGRAIQTAIYNILSELGV